VNTRLKTEMSGIQAVRLNRHSACISVTPNITLLYTLPTKVPRQRPRIHHPQRPYTSHSPHPHLHYRPKLTIQLT